MSQTKPTSKRERYDRRKKSLRELRTPWDELYSSLAEHVSPRRWRTSVKADPKGARTKIVDSTGSFAWRTMASGMHSGISSPARPWFKLMTPDPALREFGPVKEYLNNVERRLREVFAASNVYDAFHYGYGDLGLFGQPCMLLVEDRQTVLRMIVLQQGSFWIARDHRGVASSMVREFSWSVERIIERFGLKNVSKSIRDCYDRSDYDETFTINHLIEPRRDRDHRSPTKENKPWASCYWEEGEHARGIGDRDKMLSVSGFDRNPIISAPWERVAEDHWAEGPGSTALPDVKMLQLSQTRKTEAIDKKVRPPMKAPPSMRNNPASLLPGSITYVEDPSGHGYKAAIDVQLQINDLRQDIAETQQRVSRSFYADLFLMLQNMEGVQPRNVFELAERKEEKLLALGPVLESVHGHQLQPTIDGGYQIGNAVGLFGPPPEELVDVDLRLEFISILAQAQKAVATGALERGMQFASSIAAAVPDAMDKLDTDQAIDEYWDMLGAPPSVIRSDDDVAAMREQRAAQNAKAVQAEEMSQVAPAMKQGAEAAEALSNTAAAGGGTLLERLGIG